MKKKGKKMKYNHESIFETSLRLGCAVRASFLTCGLFVLLLIGTSEPATAQGKTTTHPDGSADTTAPSNDYGEGGTVRTTSDKNRKLVETVYFDKCGRVRQKDVPGAHMYLSPDKSESVIEDETERGTNYEHRRAPNLNYDHMHADTAKWLIEHWKKAPIPPCDKTDVEPGPPEKPKDHPNPLGKVLQNVSIGIGASGGRTIGRDDHKGDHRVTDHKRTSSTTKKVSAGCKCHPCTCSPCTCH